MTEKKTDGQEKKKREGRREKANPARLKETKLAMKVSKKKTESAHAWPKAETGGEKRVTTGSGGEH